MECRARFRKYSPRCCGVVAHAGRAARRRGSDGGGFVLINQRVASYLLQESGLSLIGEMVPCSRNFSSACLSSGRDTLATSLRDSAAYARYSATVFITGDDEPQKRLAQSQQNLMPPARRFPPPRQDWFGRRGDCQDIPIENNHIPAAMRTTPARRAI
jgi:hypothetical protein